MMVLPNKLLCVCFFLLICFSTIKAQSPSSYKLSSIYDFNVTTVYFIHQAINKNVWIGTNQGLYEFNGSSFKKYLNSNFQTEYSEIKEDVEGRIWCQNFTGQIFYVAQNELILYKNVTNYSVDGLFNFNITKFPKIYIGTDLGCYVTNFNDFSIKKSTILNDGALHIDSEPVKQINFYNANLIYSNGRDIIGEHTKGNETLINLKDKSNLSHRIFVLNKRLLALCNFSDHAKIIVHSKEHKKEIRFDDIPTVNLSSLYYDQVNEHYWIGTIDGVYIFDKQFKKINTFLKNESISSITKDHENNIWIGTLNNGIFIIPGIYIQTYDTHFGNNRIIDIKAINNSDLYVLNDAKKLYKYDFSKKKFLFLKTLDKKVKNLVYNPIRKGFYLSGSNYFYDIKKKKVVFTPIDNIKAGNKLSDTSYLISNTAHAYVYNYTNNSVTSLKKKRSYNNAICLQTNHPYISYSDGLFYYPNKEEIEITHDGKPLLVNTALTSHNKNGVWACDIQGKLYKIDHGKAFRVHDFKKNIKKIIHKDSMLFLATDKGLITYHIKNKTENYINKLDGLASNIVTGMEVIEDSLYVATLEGLSKLGVNYNYKNKVRPEVSITALAVNGKPLPIQKNYSLTSDENNIVINLSTYALRSQQQFKLYYKMAGIDEKWVETSGNSIQFIALKSGNYHLEIKAVNEDNYESKNIKKIHFNIAYPYYQKWWFYVIIFTLSSALVLFVFSNILKNKTLEKQLANSTITTIKAQMNPHFMFNAMNTIQSLILKENKEQAYKYLTKLAFIVRENLNMSDKPFIAIEDELKLLTTYLELEKLRFKKDFEYHITIDESLKELLIPSMIIQPFVENAIKHGLLHKKGLKKIVLSFKKEKHLICTIKDNGIGRKASQIINKERGVNSHESFSTSSIQKRFDILKKYYKLSLGFWYKDLYEDSHPTGTLVTINIPYTHAYGK